MGDTQCGNLGILKSGQWDWNSFDWAVSLEYHRVVVCGSGRMLELESCEVVVCGILFSGIPG